jgi:hypothetical protein
MTRAVPRPAASVGVGGGDKSGGTTSPATSSSATAAPYTGRPVVASRTSTSIRAQIEPSSLLKTWEDFHATKSTAASNTATVSPTRRRCRLGADRSRVSASDSYPTTSWDMGIQCTTTSNYAASTKPAVEVGGGTGSPCSRRDSMESATASPMLRPTSSGVSPQVVQPGRSGTYAEQLPSAGRSMT